MITTAQEIFKEKFLEAISEKSIEKLANLCLNYDEMNLLIDKDLGKSQKEVESIVLKNVNAFFDINSVEFANYEFINHKLYHLGSEMEINGNKFRMIGSYELTMTNGVDILTIKIDDPIYVKEKIKINNPLMIKVEKQNTSMKGNDKELPVFFEKGELIEAGKIISNYSEIPKDCDGFFDRGILFKEDLYVDGDLNLNESDGFLIVVLGDLRVTGTIINNCGDIGDILVVLGDVYAENLIIGGSLVYFKNNVYIKNVIYGYDNNGFLEINKLQSGTFIGEDYPHTTFNEISDKCIIFGSESNHKGYPYDDLKEIIYNNTNNIATKDEENDIRIDTDALIEYLYNKKGADNLIIWIDEYLKRKNFTCSSSVE